MNPILQKLGNQPPQNNLRTMYQAYKFSQNPKADIERLIQQNPVLSPIVSGGGDLKTTFYSMCQQRGVDPEQILAQFK